jgi:hypothetical protein
MNFVVAFFVALLSFGQPSVDCVTVMDDTVRLACYAKERGLPANATWSDITANDSENSRRESAQKRGLPSTATWSDITAHDSENSRREYAARLGLPANATWADIAKHD